MAIISLEGIEFFAYHGYYEEERKMGNYFLVDISVETNSEIGEKHDELSGTLNYESLFSITKKCMANKSKLLEHLAAKIVDETKQQHPDIESISLSIRKKSPPIGNTIKSSNVSLIKTF